MRIRLKKEYLIDAVQSIAGVVNTKNTLPILSNILIETSGNNVKFTATDLDIGIINLISADILDEGAVTVPAKRFIDIIREFPSGSDIEIYTKNNNILHIENADIVFKVVGMAKDEYPQLPIFEDEKSISINQSELRNMLIMTQFSMSRDETRFVLNGIFCLVKEKSMEMVATDGRRLSFIETHKDFSNINSKHIIIPAKTVYELISSLRSDGDDDALISFFKNQVVFKLGNLTIVSRLIEGEFPNYEQAIPMPCENKLKVSTMLLRAAIKRASILTTQESQAIKLNLKKNSLHVTKVTPEIGEVDERLDVEYEGDDMSIGFNHAYLTDVLKNIDEETVIIELQANDKPAVIRLTHKGYVYIVLPMQVI